MFFPVIQTLVGPYLVNGLKFELLFIPNLTHNKKDVCVSFEVYFELAEKQLMCYSTEHVSFALINSSVLFRIFWMHCMWFEFWQLLLFSGFTLGCRSKI